MKSTEEILKQECVNHIEMRDNPDWFAEFWKTVYPMGLKTRILKAMQDYADQFKGVCGGCHWVKAGEKLPAECGKVHWRFTETKDPITYGIAYRFAISEDKSDEVEWLDESPCPQLKELQKSLEDSIELLKEYEQWEADLISDNAMWWPNVPKDRISGKTYDKMLELQDKRNAILRALKK